MSEAIVTFDWNNERNGRLTILYDKGWSFAQIADDLGCTRNAAIGKAHRLNLPAREHVVVVAKEKRQHKVAYRVITAIKDVFTVAKKDDRTAPDKAHRCLIIALTDTTCRYPLWAFDAPMQGSDNKYYCGAPGAEMSARQPYCPYHARLCNPPQR